MGAETPKRVGFATEADLCSAFIDAVVNPRTQSWERKEVEAAWRAYPETAGWDILLVRISDGLQIGIEAKLVLNAKVLDQALLSYGYEMGVTGPDYRAVLVPEGKTGSLARICGMLGITVIAFRGYEQGYHEAFKPSLPSKPGRYTEQDWHEWMPVHRCPLPDYLPDVVAGASAPVALTDWKVRAIKLAILLEERALTRSDFKELEISPSRWTDPHSGWLTKTPGGYVPGPKMPDFKAQHPRNYDEIRADKAKWAPVRSFAAPLTSPVSQPDLLTPGASHVA